MDSATKLKRHTQLWSSGETSVRRIGIGGVAFALIILLAVIEPYHIKSAGKQSEIDTQKSDLAKLRAEIDRIPEVQNQLGAVTNKITEQPWTDEIQKLKDEFAAGEVAAPRQRSNEILDEIASELRTDVILPLRAATAKLPEGNRLAKVPDELERAIDDWLERYKPVRWWSTRLRKDETAYQIGAELTSLLNGALEDAAKIKRELEAAAATKAKKLKGIETAIQNLEAELQKVMERAIPTWARGILTVKQMLVLFPWLLAAIAIYLVVTALRTSRHFHAMADGEGWSAEDRSDPLLSTPWTLTPRRIPGSIATFLTYGSVLGVLGACVYRSQHPPTSAAAGSVQASVDVIARQSSLSAMVAYGFLVAAIAVVIVVLVRDRQTS
ncbi:MAG: hypothetical protein QNJ07_13195 [Woeseiaceae bacterium]|nr:hypothetical protein [Woeseiaceae bacterium]